MKYLKKVIYYTVILFFTSCVSLDVEPLLDSWYKGDVDSLKVLMDSLRQQILTSTTKESEDIKYIIDFIEMEIIVNKFINEQMDEDLEISEIDPMIDKILFNYSSMQLLSNEYKYIIEDYIIDYNKKCVDLLVCLVLEKETYYLDKIKRTVRNISDDSYVTLISYIEDLNNLSYLSFISDIVLKSAVSKEIEGKGKDNKFEDVAKNLNRFFNKNISDFNYHKRILLDEKDKFFKHKDDIEKLLESYNKISTGWNTIESKIQKIVEMAEKFKTIVDERNIEKTLVEVKKGMEELKEINEVYNRLSLRLYDIQTNKNIIDLEYFDQVILNETRTLDREKLQYERIGAINRIIDNIENIQETSNEILNTKKSLRAEYLKIKAIEIKEQFTVNDKSDLKNIFESYEYIFSNSSDKTVYAENDGLLYELTFTDLDLKQLAVLNFILYKNMQINNVSYLKTSASDMNWVNKITRFREIQIILKELLTGTIEVNNFFKKSENIIRRYYIDDEYNNYLIDYFNEYKDSNIDVATFILMYVSDIVHSKPVHGKVYSEVTDPNLALELYEFSQYDIDYGNLYFAYFKSKEYMTDNFKDLEESKPILYNELILLRYLYENSFKITKEDLVTLPHNVVWPELNLEIAEYMLEEFYSSKNKKYLISSLNNINAFIYKQQYINANELDNLLYKERLEKFNAYKEINIKNANSIKLRILVELGKYDEARTLLEIVDGINVENILRNIEISEYYENLLFSKKNKIFDRKLENIEIEFQRVRDLKNLIEYFEDMIQNKMLCYLGFSYDDFFISNDLDIDYNEYLYIENLKSIFLEKIIFSSENVDEFDRVFLADFNSSKNKDQLNLYVSLIDLLKLNLNVSESSDKIYESISNSSTYFKLLYYYWTDKKDFLYYLDKEVNSSNNDKLKYDIPINFLKYRFYLKYKNDSEIKARIIGYDKMKDILLITLNNSNESNWTSITYNHYLEEIIKSFLIGE